jgi:hypothetical protein
VVVSEVLVWLVARMRIAVGSAFRDCQDNVYAYVQRVSALRDLLGPVHEVRMIAAEGDSSDQTRERLGYAARILGIDIEFVECSHGLRWFGSTEEPDRMRAMSVVGNAIFAGVNDQDDVLVYVEQDLVWEPQTIQALMHQALDASIFDVVSPLVMAGQCFYDTWGFRIDEDRFSPFFPYHRALCHDSGMPSLVDSVGSCLVMRAEVARACRIRNEYCLVGWCADARAKGYRIGVRTDLTVRQA